MIDKITEYLSSGGYFNPELMEHDKVRDLLMDIREQLAVYAKAIMDKDAEILRLRFTLAEIRALHAKSSKLLSEHYVREVDIYNSQKERG